MALTTVRSTGIGSLPAISGANLTSLNASNISSGTLSTSRYVQGGITMFDAWYVTSTQTHSSGEHTWTSWSRMSNESSKKATNIGSAMTQSSGVFTFPTTGKYWVMFKTYTNGNANTHYAGVIMKNNSNVSINEQYTNREAASNVHNGCMAMTFIDVDDVTDNACKIKFNSNQGATSTWASGGSMETQAFFVRIGDT